MSDVLFDLTRACLMVAAAVAFLFGGLPVLVAGVSMILAMFGVPAPEFVWEYLGHAYGLL
jgi:hypothetical protein